MKSTHVQYNENIHTLLTLEDVQSLVHHSTKFKRLLKIESQAARTIHLLADSYNPEFLFEKEGVTSKELITELWYVTPAQWIYYARELLKPFRVLIVSETESGTNRYWDNVSWYRYKLAFPKKFVRI